MDTRPDLDEIARRRRRWLVADKQDRNLFRLTLALIEQDLRALIEYAATNPPLIRDEVENL